MSSSSPPYSDILVRDNIENKVYVVKTQPFFSLFYHINGQSVPCRKHFFKSRKRDCVNILRRSTSDLPCQALNNIPLNINNEFGKKNLLFVLGMLVSTIVVGTITFSYWSLLLRENSDPEYKSVIEKRSLFLSVLFIVMTMILSVMIYELFTLKQSSLRWFYHRQNVPFYKFLNTRKIWLWVFLFLWLFVVVFTTAVVSKRSDKFKKTIAINILSGMTLLLAQYLYYQTMDSRKKLFFLFVSVFIIGLVVYLLYGI